MHCERCNQRLSELIDGRLNARDLEGLRAHIAACRRCHDDYREMLMVRSVMRELPQPEPSPGFWDGALGAVRRRAESPQRIGWSAKRRSVFARLGVAAAATCAILAVLNMRPDTPRGGLPISSEPAFVEISPASLISFHAIADQSTPLADSGRERYTITEADSRDYADNGQLDIR